MMQLKKIIDRIDRKGYKAYHDLKGTHSLGKYQLHIDHVQADPYASPSRARITIPLKELTFEKDTYEQSHRYVAFTDYLARVVGQAIVKQNAKKSIHIDAPGQEILERTAVVIKNDQLDIRLSLHLPARGRTILGSEAKKRLTEQLPSIVEEALIRIDHNQLDRHLKLSDDQLALRQFLKDNDGLTFVHDGAVLPRESGVSQRPLKSMDTKKFRSPKAFEAYAELPHAGQVRGMLIKKGVTVIVGGGYHGKSTLLHAIEHGVYNHVGGDGRELVVTDESAFKIRAEDGRQVSHVDISAFISELPNKKSTTNFSTENASGSTSQAANILEAIEAGTELLLIDEDTSATNFMIRDYRMQKLVARDKEPITPFIDRVRDLYESKGISTIVVVGGSGDYLEVADRVLMLDEYEVLDVTNEANKIIESDQAKREKVASKAFQKDQKRIPKKEGWNARKGKRDKVRAKGVDLILYGQEEIDLSSVEQIVDSSQTRAIAQILYVLAQRHMNGQNTIEDLLNHYEKETRHELEQISSFNGQHPGDFARPRRLEVAAALNRLRTLQIVH